MKGRLLDSTEAPERRGPISVERPPAPPLDVTARVDGWRAVVTWRPSTNAEAPASYRVTRRTGRGGAARAEPLGEVTGTELVDDSIGVGVDAHYTVVAVREGHGVSETVASAPVMIAPDVSDVTTAVGESEVSVSWRRPPEALRVEVRRGAGTPPHDRGAGVVSVEHDGSGFHDTSVRTDQEYFYRVRAVYMTSQGWTRGSPGLLIRAVPGPKAEPVRDLRIDSGEGGPVASWTPPKRGRVSLYTDRSATTSTPGPPLEGAPLEGTPPEGSPLEGEPVRGADGRCRMPLSLPAGVAHVVAVTVDGESRVRGASVRVTVAPPVTGLRAERFDTVVRLGWTWPEHTSSALVTWSADTEGGPVNSGVSGPSRWDRCSRVRYDAEGGFETPMGSGPLVVTVRTTILSGADEVLSVPSTVRVHGRVALDYRVEPLGLMRRERLVSLSANVPCRMPRIAVVFTPGEVQPHAHTSRDQVLSVLPARDLSAGEGVSVRVRPPWDSVPGWLTCFPLDPGTEVRLRQPPVRELRL